MNHAHPTTRNGTLVVCVLVCLLVAGTIVMAMTQSALRSRHEVRLQHQMQQTLLLLDAGVLRAARMLEQSDQYEGESWRGASAITQFGGGVVEISVTADTERAGWHLVSVTAGLGVAIDGGKPSRAPVTRRSHTFRVKISDSSSNPEPSNAE